MIARSTCMLTVMLAQLTSFPVGCTPSLSSACCLSLALAFLLTLWPSTSYSRSLSSLQEIEFLHFWLIILSSATDVCILPSPFKTHPICQLSYVSPGYSWA